MNIEILVFANFEYRIEKTTTKVIVGDRVQDEERYNLNWKEYSDLLKSKGFDVSPQVRPFFNRYQAARPDKEFFHKFMIFQDEIKEILDTIAGGRSIPLELWQSLFREAEKIGEFVLPKPEVKGPIREEDLQNLTFEKHVTAETYRAFLYGELRRLIVERKIFRLRKCPECNVYFYDGTKNGRKIYCNIQVCGNKAKQRAWQRRRAEKIAKVQPSLDFKTRETSRHDFDAGYERD